MPSGECRAQWDSHYPLSPSSGPAHIAVDDSPWCPGTVLGVAPVLMALSQKHLFLALLFSVAASRRLLPQCCFSDAQGFVGRQGWLLPSQLPSGALGGRVSSCPAVPCSSSAAPLPQLPVSLQPLLLVTALLWRAPGQPFETLSLHPLPLFLPYVSPCLPLSRNFPRKLWAQTGKEQGKEHMHCLGACVVR